MSKSSKPSDVEFVEVVMQMLNFLLPKHLAKDLKVTAQDIEDWADGANLPEGELRTRVFDQMKRHEVWDEM